MPPIKSTCLTLTCSASEVESLTGSDVEFISSLMNDEVDAVPSLTGSPTPALVVANKAKG